MRAFRCSVRLAFVVLVFVASVLVPACRSGVGQGQTPAPSPEAPDEEVAMLSLSSSAFEDGGLIPVEYANAGVLGGQNASIPYEWSDVPEGTESLALVLVDLHPVARSWIHWMVTAIPPGARSLARGASGRDMPEGSIEHPNTSGTLGYGGPQPPAGTGKHEYEARLYALDIASPDPRARTLDEFNAAIDGHVLATASYSGLFGR